MLVLKYKTNAHYFFSIVHLEGCICSLRIGDLVSGAMHFSNSGVFDGRLLNYGLPFRLSDFLGGVNNVGLFGYWCCRFLNDRVCCWLCWIFFGDCRRLSQMAPSALRLQHS